MDSQSWFPRTTGNHHICAGVTLSQQLEGFEKYSHFSSLLITVKTRMSRLCCAWPALAKNSVASLG